MKTTALAAGLCWAMAVGAAYAGDATVGEKAFRNCQACHALTAADGTKIRTGGRAGPDLYGVVGRKAGGLEGYTYSPGLAALNASGLIWTEEKLAAFVTNPNSFLESELGDGHVSKMPFALPTGGEDVAAYLAAAAAK